jgi:phosphomannomutase
MTNNKEERDKIKKLVWKHLKQTILTHEEILAEKRDKKTRDIIGNLDNSKYLAEKYKITENHVKECIEVIKDNLTHNPNVQNRIVEMVEMVRKHLEEGVGCQLTKEESRPVVKVIAELTLSLLVQKNM